MKRRRFEANLAALPKKQQDDIIARLTALLFAELQKRRSVKRKVGKLPR